MNCFLADEVSGALEFLREKGITEIINEAEVSVSGDDFGLGNYVSVIESERKKKNVNKKIHVTVIDFTKDTHIKAEDIFTDTVCDEYIFVSLFKFEKKVSTSATALSEREILALPEFDSSFRSVKSMVDFEKNLKPYAEKHNIKVIRYTDIYGPEINTKNRINGILEKFRGEKKVTLSKGDYRSVLSASYISLVLKDLYSVIAYGKKGNIYNGSNNLVTVADIKNSIYKSFADKEIQLDFDISEEVSGSTCGIAAHKIKAVSGENTVNTDDSLYKTLASEEDYIRRYVKESYDGKIDRIREREFTLLSEVDRICKKHKINYYLVGGSLLGAVRNEGFIPWDDDVDICMLREDFEKFRKVCPEELSDEFAYQSYRDEKSTHYIYDKIRLKGTYFSSEHSIKYDDMENGVFLDVLVFDKTANSKILQRIHVFLIVMLRRFIHIRWTKEPVKGKFAFVSALILPLVCMLPFGFYHSLFEKILRFFERSKKSRFLLDGTGLYIKKGAFPMEWAVGSENVKFENLSFPGIKDSKSYLSRWYGENYITPPSVSKRTSGHIISRLDLGEYLFKDSSDRSISLKGELYDK